LLLLLNAADDARLGKLAVVLAHATHSMVMLLLRRGLKEAYQSATMKFLILVLGVVLVLAASSKFGRVVCCIHLVFGCSGEAEFFKVHLSETIVWCSSGWLIEIFLEIWMCGCKVDNVIHIKAVIPSWLLLD